MYSIRKLKSSIIFFNSRKKYRVEDVFFFEGIVLDRGLKGQGVKEFQSETEIENESEFSFFTGFARE